MVIPSRVRLFAYSSAVSFALGMGCASAAVVSVPADQIGEAPSASVSEQAVASTETTTWAMMVLCVAGVGFAVFRRGPKGRLDIPAS
jgi:hypothetical protein